VRHRVTFAVAVAVNVLVLYWPSAPGTGGIPGLDKVVHVLVFLAVAWTGVAMTLPAGPLAAVLVVHAVVSEIVQGRWMAARSGDPRDVLADVVGVAIGVIGATWRHDRPRDRPRADRPPARGRPGPR
jgi:hypothetical protein